MRTITRLIGWQVISGVVGQLRKTRNCDGLEATFHVFAALTFRSHVVGQDGRHKVVTWEISPKIGLSVEPRSQGNLQQTAWLRPCFDIFISVVPVSLRSKGFYGLVSVSVTAVAIASQHHFYLKIFSRSVELHKCNVCIIYAHSTSTMRKLVSRVIDLINWKSFQRATSLVNLITLTNP